MPETNVPYDYELMWTHLKDGLAAILKAEDAPDAMKAYSPEQIMMYGLTVENIHKQMLLMEQMAQDAYEQSSKAE